MTKNYDRLLLRLLLTRSLRRYGAGAKVGAMLRGGDHVLRGKLGGGDAGKGKKGKDGKGRKGDDDDEDDDDDEEEEEEVSTKDEM